jgi:RNA polymerase sigma-70 factor (ECF subfamily)
MDEQQAILCLKRGDIDGLEFLVGLYQVRAVRTAYLITRDTALAEDVAQEAFLQAYRSIRHFDQDRSFGPWFMRSVVHAALKAAQKNSRHEDHSSQRQSFDELFADSASVEEQVETIEFQGRVWAAMRDLTPRQRAAVVQRYFLDMSEREMAAQLEAPAGTVKWLLHEARERLRSLLSERTSK